MNCRACGAELAADAVYCHKCGVRIDGEDNPVESFRPTNHHDQPEETLWEGRYSSKDLVGLWAIEGFATLLLFVVGYNWSNGTVWLTILGLVAAMWIYSTGLYLYRRASVHYRLTTQRFFHERGILRHITDRIEVIDMDDIATEQSLLQRFVNVGQIRIVSSDRTSPVLVLRGIENIHRVAQMLDDARRQERLKRGLHIESI